MTSINSSFRVVRNVVIGLSLCACANAQQQENPRGWSFYPSAQLGAVYNDNLLFRRGDAGGSAVYGRYGGTVDVTHVGAGSSFQGGYALTGEQFSGEREDLSEFPASQRASLSLTSRVGSHGSLNAGASYMLSRNPSEVFDPVGIEFGRRRAEGYSASAGFERRLSASHSLSVQYSFGFRKLDPQSGDPDDRLESASHEVSLGWNQNLSVRTVGTLQYSFRRFRNESQLRVLGFNDPLSSHAGVYGWTHQLSQRATVSFNVGPNFYQDVEFNQASESLLGTAWKVTPQASASYSYSWEKMSFDLSYARRQHQFVGASGQVITDSLSTSIGFSPVPRLSLGLSAGAQRNSQAGEVFETYRGGFHFQMELARWWALNGDYGYSFQERYFGFLDDTDLDTVGRSRNQAYLGIVIGKTIPLE